MTIINKDSTPKSPWTAHHGSEEVEAVASPTLRSHTARSTCLVNLVLDESISGFTQLGSKYTIGCDVPTSMTKTREGTELEPGGALRWLENRNPTPDT